MELNIHVQVEKGKFCCRMSTSSIKRHIGRFHVVVVQWTSKKCTKNRDCRFAHKTNCFFFFALSLSSSS